MHGERVDDACRELHQLEPRGRLFGFFVCAWSVSHPSQLIIAGTARLTSCVSSSLSGLSSGIRCAGSGIRMSFRLRLCLASRGLRHLEGRGSGGNTTFGLSLLSGLVGGCIMTWSVSGRGECYESGERTRSVLSRSGSTFGVLLGSLLLLEDSLELVLDVLEEGWDAGSVEQSIRAHAR